MGKTIVITGGKGGIGKSTTAVNIASLLAKQNKKTLLIDLDTGLRNLDVVMGLENEVRYTLLDVLKNTVRLKQAIIKDERFQNLYLLAGAQKYDKDILNPDKIRDFVEPLKKIFDYIFLDSPAGIDDGFKNAVNPCDEAILVTTPEIASLRDADRVLTILTCVYRKPTSLIVNKVNPYMEQKGGMICVNDILDILPIPLLGIVPEDKLLSICANFGEILSFEKNSLTYRAYENITGRILGMEVELLDLQKKTGFFLKLRQKLAKG